MIAFYTTLWIFTLIFPQLIISELFTNPLNRKDGSDPFIVYNDGYYYLTTTTWKDVKITRAKTLEGLKAGQVKVVYQDKTANRCCNVWAPGMFVGIRRIVRSNTNSDRKKSMRLIRRGISTSLQANRKDLVHKGCMSSKVCTQSIISVGEG